MRNNSTSYELFGIECGDGWKHLIQPLIEQCKKEGATIVQIKEKFGGLRFYVSNASLGLCQKINDAEHRSYNICEVCGEPGKKYSPRGWIKTLCEVHGYEYTNPL